MKCKVVCSLVAIMLVIATLDAPAWAAQDERKGVPREAARSSAARQTSRSTTTTDHRQTLESSLEEVDSFRQWMIGANRRGSVDAILNRGVNPRTTPQSFYNLKGLQNKRFLQHEHQGTARGINIGWTSNAKAQTAVDQAHWGFFPKNTKGPRANVNGLRGGPIVYGEIVAIGWWPPNPRHYSEFSVTDGRLVPQFLTHTSRNVGPNLEWSKHGAAYEWVILGGKPGTTVRRGEDRVILFNLKNKKPLLYGSRQFGAHLGFLGYSAFNAPWIVDQKDIELTVWQSLMLKPARDATL